MGFNGLGALEIVFALLPIVLWPQRLMDNGSRLIMLLTSLTVVALDVWWRVSGRDEVHWVRAISPYEGGAIVYLPGWLVGAAVAGLAVFSLITA